MGSEPHRCIDGTPRGALTRCHLSPGEARPAALSVQLDISTSDQPLTMVKTRLANPIDGGRDRQEVELMLPFATLDPGLTEPAYAAYDAAWQELSQVGHDTSAYGDESAARRRVTDALIKAMHNGEHDPARLKAVALAAIMRMRK